MNVGGKGKEGSQGIGLALTKCFVVQNYFVSEGHSLERCPVIGTVSVCSGSLRIHIVKQNFCRECEIKINT
jgi:hypothetical protein